MRVKHHNWGNFFEIPSLLFYNFLI
jgi:hypothetical protein